MSVNKKNFWKDEQNSLREGEEYLPDLFKRKAEEFASLFLPEEMNLPTIDLGCGAGEILEYLVRYIHVNEGIDISENLIKTAQKRLKNNDVNLHVCDALDYIPSVHQNIWISAAALSQFLPHKGIRQLIKSFQENVNAQSLFLFDTIDPAKYILMGSVLISYRPQQIRTARHKLARVLLSSTRLWFQNIFYYNKDTFDLGGKMGFAFRPRYWIILAQQFNLSVEIVSSRYMEYRYHVILRK